MNNYQLTIGHLYGSLMNTYGDDGNIITLKKRAEWRGVKVTVKDIKIGERLKKGGYDLYFFGGGQDQNQEGVSKDLIRNKSALKSEVKRGVPLLSICGGYQLLGAYYQPQKGPKMTGLGIFQAYSKASNQRMIGNLVIKGGIFGDLVGFENHSGKTFLEKGAIPMGKVIKGFGNNSDDKTEGCVVNNAFGCYLHGSLLPKNPKLADFLISKALELKYGKRIELKPLNDSLEDSAHQKAVKRFS